jgi:hypothetical protein
MAQPFGFHGGNDMKAALIFLLLASPAFAQNKLANTSIAPGCGAEDVKFDVKRIKGPHPVTQPDAGKALVYFIEDDTDFNSVFKPTTRAGLDGGWVGATHGNSYFYFSVDPGEHHLCASRQSAEDSSQAPTRAVAHFTAEAGNVYYFRVKNRWRGNYESEIDFAPLDSDEGVLLASTYSSTTSRVKK